MRFGPPPRIMILRRLGRLRLALLLVGGVQVGGGGGELGRAGVDALVDRRHLQLVALVADGLLGHVDQLAPGGVGEALALERPQPLGAERPEARRRAPAPPRRSGPRSAPGTRGRCACSSWMRSRVQPARKASATYSRRFGARARAARRRACRRPHRSAAALSSGLRPSSPVSSPRSAFCSDSWKVRPMAITSPDRLHLRRQAVVRGRELLEREARDLGHHVVDRRLEGGRRRPAGDVVLQLIERVADGELGGDLGDREAGRLGGERRGARDARVHLDDQQAPVLRD